MRWTATGVYFYGGPFSNFHPAVVKIDGKKWDTTEAYYQAQKTHDKDTQEMIRMAETPFEAKRIGQRIKLRADWDKRKYDVMLKALRAKFSQHKELANELKKTVGFKIYEDSPTDAIWGLGPNKDGQNLLGKALMAVRKEMFGE